jgi:hypothetical protein
LLQFKLALPVAVANKVSSLYSVPERLKSADKVNHLCSCSLTSFLDATAAIPAQSRS